MHTPFCSASPPTSALFFFFNDTATTEIYTLSLHDALPILVFQVLAVEQRGQALGQLARAVADGGDIARHQRRRAQARSEEHTSELQSQSNLVCRLLLEKKKKKSRNPERHSI